MPLQTRTTTFGGLISKLPEKEWDPTLISALFDISKTGSAEAKARAHNKTMHIYNGNPLPTDMDMIDDAPEWSSMLRQTTKRPEITSISLDNFLSFHNSPNVWYTDRIRSDIINKNNIITRNVELPLSSTILVPRMIFDSEGRALDAAIRLDIDVVWLTGYIDNPIKCTSLAKELATISFDTYCYPECLDDPIELELAIQMEINNVYLRQGVKPSADFSALDIVTLSRISTNSGLSLERMTLILSFLLETTVLSIGHEHIPASIIQAYDDRSIPVKGDGVLGINNSPVFGEHCGMAANAYPLFPFVGITGDVRFHATIETVANNNKPHAVYIPASILQASHDGWEALAIMVACFSEWPFALYTYDHACRPTCGTPDAEAQMIRYAVRTSLIRIPGRTELDIILPRRVAALDPKNIETANAMVSVRPKNGPVTRHNMTASAYLNVFWKGMSPNEIAANTYPLSAYLATWALNFNINVLTNVIGTLGTLTGLSKVWPTTLQMASLLTFHYPALTMDSMSPEPNSKWQRESSNASGNQSEYTLTDWPQQNHFSFRYCVHDTNEFAWNKVVTGLGTSDDIRPEPAYVLNEDIGSPKIIYRMRNLSMVIGITYQTLYSLVGQTTKSWEAKNDNNYRFGFITFIMAFFVAFMDKVPPNTCILVHLFEQLFDKSVSTSSGLSVFSRYRMLPQTLNCPIALINDQWTRLDGLCPAYIPDVFVGYFTDRLPKNIYNFPPPFGPKSTVGYSSGLIPHSVGPGEIGPYIDSPNAVYLYATNAIPDVPSTVRFNEKIFYASNAAPVTFRGEAPDGEVFLPPGSFACCRPYVASIDHVTADGLLAANLNAYATCDHIGRRIIPVLKKDKASIVLGALARINGLSFPAWRLASVVQHASLASYSDKESTLVTLTRENLQRRKETDAAMLSQEIGKLTLTPSVETSTTNELSLV